MRQFKNILVHSLVNIGDVLLSTSAVALLKQICPEAKITMMVKQSAAELVINNPVIDDVIIFKYKEKQKSWSSVWHQMQEIRSHKFDLSISFDRKLRPALICFFAGIPVRVGPDRAFDNKPSWITTLFTDVIHTPDDFMHTHQAQIFQSIVRGFFRSDGTALPVIGRITETHRHKARHLTQQLPPAKKKIALCIKGTYHLKNWPTEKFVALIRKLATHYDAAFFIVGAPEDHAYAQTVINQSDIPVLNFCGQTSLLEYAALMEISDLLITIDTGGMHIAATTAVPIVGIFRCVSEKRWYPSCSAATAVSIRKTECPPMKSPENCPMHYCVEEISVEEVFEAAMKWIH